MKFLNIYLHLLNQEHCVFALHKNVILKRKDDTNFIEFLCNLVWPSNCPKLMYDIFLVYIVDSNIWDS